MEDYKHNNGSVAETTSKQDQGKRKKSGKSKARRQQTKNNDRSTMEARMFRARIQEMTGSDQIRINDPRYHEKMREKICQQYELRMDEEEKAREEAERERMRRLVARGIIGVDELRNDKVLSRECKRDHRQRNKKHSRHRKSSPQRVKSAPQTTTHRRVHSSSDDKSVNKRRPATAVVTSRHSEHDSVTSSVYESSDRSSVYSSRYSRASRPGSNTSRISIRSCRYEHPIVKEMREEESLDGLYQLAARIIPEVRIHDDSPRADRELTEEERIQAEENKYKGKKVVAKLKF